MTKLELILNLPFAWPYVLIYLLSRQRRLINMDIDAFYAVQHPGLKENYLIAFYREFITYSEFRSLFYHRLGRWIKLLSWLYPRQDHLSIDVPSDKLGGGIFIQHGYCTDISARSVGEGLFINQKVTIGWNKDGCPTIGKNCRIGAGAVVLGNIIIGDNVKIGANAIVVHNVPSNTTVCSAESVIVKQNGVKVKIDLSSLKEID